MLSRLIRSATACRTRLSLNGSLSVRMCSCRCCEARSSITVTFGSVSSGLPLTGENCASTSTSSPWTPRIAASSFS